MNYLERAISQINEGKCADAVATLSGLRSLHPTEEADIRAIRRALLDGHWNPDHYRKELDTLDNLVAELASLRAEAAGLQEALLGGLPVRIELATRSDQLRIVSPDGKDLGRIINIKV